MKQLTALLTATCLVIVIMLSTSVYAFELADYSYICFSHDALFSEPSMMIQSLKCVNTIGIEHIEQLEFYADGSWSALLDSYGQQTQIFGKTSELH